MRAFRMALLGCQVALVLSCCGLRAQEPSIGRLATVPNLSQLTRSSGYIFSGTVASVATSVVASPGDVATVRVTFRIEQAILGVHTGQLLTITEWAGLWNSGERYRPGERVLLFLYPPSRLGLTSPVGGTQGRFSVSRSGQIILNASASSARPSTGTAVPLRSLVRTIREAGKE